MANEVAVARLVAALEGDASGFLGVVEEAKAATSGLAVALGRSGFQAAEKASDGFAEALGAMGKEALAAATGVEKVEAASAEAFAPAVKQAAQLAEEVREVAKEATTAAKALAAVEAGPGTATAPAPALTGMAGGGAVAALAPPAAAATQALAGLEKQVEATGAATQALGTGYVPRLSSALSRAKVSSEAWCTALGGLRQEVVAVGGAAGAAGPPVLTLSQRLEKARAGFERGQQAAQKWEAVTGVAQRVAAGFALVSAAALGVAGASVKLASDLNETTSAMGVAFGGRAGEVEAWAKTTAQAMGRGATAIRENVTNLQLMLKPLVGNEAAAIKLSKAFTTLSVDAGSLLNVADEEALAAFRSGLTGETEPLKRFGVAMTDAALDAFMLEKGLRAKMNTLQESAKVQVRAAFILERLSLAQGDAAATADSFANQSKKLQGSLQDVAAEFGQALLPAATRLLNAGNALVDWFRSLSGGTRKWVAYGTAAVGVVAGLGAAALGLVAALGPVVAGLQAMGITWAAVGTAAGTAWAAVLAPVAAVAAAVAGIILLAGALRQAWEANLGGVQEKWAAVTGFFQARLKDMAEGFSVMMEVGFLVFNSWKDGLFDFVESALRGLDAVSEGLAKLGIGSGGMADWARGALGTMQGARESTTLSRGRVAELSDSLGKTLSGWATSAGQEIGGALKAAGTGIADSFDKGMELVRGALGLGGSGATGTADARARQQAEAQALSAEMLGQVRGGKRPTFEVKKAGRADSKAAMDSLRALATGTSEVTQAMLKAMREKAQGLVGTLADSLAEAQRYMGAGLPPALQQYAATVAGLPERYARELSAAVGGPGAFSGLGQQLSASMQRVLTAESKGAAEGLSQVLAEQKSLLTQTDPSGALAKYRDLLAKKAASLADALATAAENARSQLADKFSNAFGSVSNLVQTAMQGMAAGGPIGALAAVAGDLLLRSEGFAEVMKVVEGVVTVVADTLGQVLAPFEGLIGAVGVLVTSILPALQPMFELVKAVVEPLIPPIMAMAAILGALVPVITVVLNVMRMLYLPFALLEPAMRFLFEVVRGAGLVVLEIAQVLGDAWNWVLGGIQGFLRSIGLGGLATDMEALRMDTGALSASMRELELMTWDSAAAKAREAAETYRTTEALGQLNEELSNAPSTWKIARARFEASDPGMPGISGGAALPGSTTAGGGTVSQPAPVYNLNVQANNPEEAADAILTRLEELEFRRGRGRLRLTEVGTA